ncbi:MAG TPA: hypothetical protein PLU81_07325 [Deltaproteobacteria bacterium]|nr:hypothetical protein [Deltaproteobacteria bacterium]
MIMSCNGVYCIARDIIRRNYQLLRSLLLILLFSLISIPEGSALESIEKGRVLFTYETGSEEIIARMAESAPGILAFLDEKGLGTNRRIHVILDSVLDKPDVVVHMIPHSEIRIPLRAPGVIEEGYTQKDPWTYFLFKGLCLHGIYSMRSKIPGAAHKAFGEIVSPNVISPQWLTDGTCALLFSFYSGTAANDPFFETIFSAYVPEDVAQVSNHPGKWPGHFTYRVYGRPFLSWLYTKYGWEKIHDFLEIHGSGIIPIEIDLKAKKAFGKTWMGLWDEFRADQSVEAGSDSGLLILGYNPEPFVYWNVSGIYPGMKRVRWRSRYGYVDADGKLWVSEYDGSGISKIAAYSAETTLDLDIYHVWDPGDGGIAVTRKGARPYLVFLDSTKGLFKEKANVQTMIPGPEGALQMSGPVLNDNGNIAVAANMGGNWDIWVYDTTWRRVTTADSIEMDPCWDTGGLVFSSNATGTFQIHRSDMTPLTTCRYAAVLPRNGTFLCLKNRGWEVSRYENKEAPALRLVDHISDSPLEEKTVPDAQPYSPWKSLAPNFIAPDIYAGISDFQVGLGTWCRDVTGDYSANAGFRYSFAFDYVSWRAQAQVKGVGVGLSRYPVSYDPENAVKTEESRNEIQVFFRPHAIPGIELSLHRLAYEPLEDFGQDDTDFWGALSLNRQFKYASTGLTAESYSGGRTSLFGNIRLIFGSEIYSSFLMQAGRSWGETTPGHGTYRVGGDIGEGYFTQRPTRLFALRGFTFNILEADKALTSSIEVYWPLVNIQRGYKTMPLFLHRLYLGTFIDAGVCSETITWDERLVGAGLELITSMEVAWGNFSSFRMGIAWPVDQPDYLDEEGPVFIIQLGRPL